MIVWFLSFILLMWYITFTDLQVMNHPYISGTNPTWSKYTIILMYCRIQFASILLRIFASMFIRVEWALCVLSLFSCVRLFATTWNVVHQSPLSMGFSRQEYWSGLLFPLPGNLHNSVIKSTSPASPLLAGRFLTAELPRKPYQDCCSVILSLSLFLSVLFWLWYHNNATHKMNIHKMLFIKRRECPLLSQLLQGLFSFCCS